MSLRRRRIEDFGVTPQGLADLEVSLSDLSSVLRGADRERSLALLEESVLLCRRLLEVLGETPNTMAELARRLRAVADLRREEGDRAGAAAAVGEADQIRRRLDSIGIEFSE